jgi:hypothetical protein
LRAENAITGIKSESATEAASRINFQRNAILLRLGQLPGIHALLRRF